MSESGRILEFVEQYETWWEGDWLAVVRYDTAHGFAHKDILRPSGRAIKIRLAESDYNQAMTLAINDLQKNWQRYKTDFLGERDNYEPPPTLPKESRNQQ